MCRDVAFFAGVQGFKGALDLGANGNFGFSLALSGNVLAVGSPNDSATGQSLAASGYSVRLTLAGSMIEMPTPNTWRTSAHVAHRLAFGGMPAPGAKLDERRRRRSASIRDLAKFAPGTHVDREAVDT